MLCVCVCVCVVIFCPVSSNNKYVGPVRKSAARQDRGSTTIEVVKPNRTTSKLAGCDNVNSLCFLRNEGMPFRGQYNKNV